MPACTFTSKRSLLLLAALTGTLAFSALSYAEGYDAGGPIKGPPGGGHPPGPPQRPGGGGHSGPSAPAAGGATSSDEDDFATSPYTEYGEFNDERDEEEETLFLQTGRFFGFSVGLGSEFIDGNRGKLYKGGFPLFDMRVHYWFDFHLALDLGFYTTSHYYDTAETEGGRWNVSMFQAGVNLRYYLNTNDLSAPLTFAGPFFLAGVGEMNKTEEPSNTSLGDAKETETVYMYNIGAGLEFPIKPRKAYFQIIGKFIMANFKDTTTARFSDNGISDLRGHFYTFTGNILFTW